MDVIYVCLAIVIIVLVFWGIESVIKTLDDIIDRNYENISIFNIIVVIILFPITIVILCMYLLNWKPFK